MTKSVLEYVAKELDLFFYPINGRLRPHGIADLMAELGWYWPEEAQIDAVDILEKFDSLLDILTELNTGSDVPEYLCAIRAAVEVGQEILQLGNKLPSPSNSSYNSAHALQIIEDNAELVGQRAISLLLARYLDARLPALLGALRLSGVIQISRVAPDDEHPGFESVDINWSRFSQLLTEPERVFAELYNWGEQGPLKSDDLLRGLQALAFGLGLPASLSVVPYRLERAMCSALGARADITTLDKQMEVPLLDTFSTEYGSMMLGVRFVAVPDPRNLSEGMKGIALVVYAEGQSQLSVDITEQLKFETRGNFGAEYSVFLLPGGRVDLVDAVSGAGGVDMNLGVGLTYERTDPPFVIFGTAGGTRLECASFAAMAGLNGSPADPDFFTELDLEGASIVINASDGDSFLQALLPREPLVVSVASTMGFSSRRGFYVAGSGGLEATLPLHISRPPIDLESIYIAFGLGVSQDPELNVRVGLSGNVQLGPIAATVQRIGVQSLLTFPDGGGNLGPADLSMGFLSPTGAGLSINASGFVGGGFLDFDNDNKRYAGIVQLSAGDLELVGIGLITTQMPDGSDGFSLLINIGVEFSPPIQLPYGFTLSGVGGLIALNRTMEVDVLRAGLRTGTLNSILFPEDPIANAARIVSDLRSVFPPVNDRVVVGPMVKLGWGSPTIIQADIGIFIELPDPVRIALLGQITVALPQEHNAVIELHIDVLGVIDFEAETLSIDATIYDSRPHHFRSKSSQ